VDKCYTNLDQESKIGILALKLSAVVGGVASSGFEIDTLCENS
jgi:hypothetical protein